MTELSSKSELIIFKANTNHAKELVNCIIKCWLETYQGIFEDTILNDLPHIINVNSYKKILAGKHNIYIAKVAELAVGFIIFSPYKHNFYI